MPNDPEQPEHSLTVWTSFFPEFFLFKVHPKNPCRISGEIWDWLEGEALEEYPSLGKTRLCQCRYGIMVCVDVSCLALV